MSDTTEQIKKSIPLFGLIGTVGGFIADVLQPIAPFSSYIFFATAFATVTVGIAVFLKSSLRTKGIPTLIFAGFMMICSGLLYASQDESKKKSGVLASVVPGISTLQSSLGILHEDLETIKKSTKKIEETTTQTAEMVKRVEENTEKTARETQKVSEAVQDSTKQIVGSLEEIQKGFSQLTQAGGIIQTPTKPEEFYANARMYEQKGDSGNARRSYVKFFGFDLDYIDPHLRYQKYLKVQEGKEGAREVYSEMKEASKSFVTEYASILLYKRKIRIKKLKKFLKNNPDFSPGYFELSKEYSEARLGEQTQEDKGNEKKNLMKFFELNEKGNLLKYFMDKGMASKFINNAEERMSNLKNFDDSILKNPIKLQAHKTNQGWSLSASTIDAITELFYRFEGDDKFISTGFLDFLDPRTGKQMPNSMINAPEDLGKTKISIKYIAIGGEEKGPFEVDFDPDLALRDSMISRYKQSLGSWAKYRSFNGKDMFYISANSSCGIDRVMYAWDSDENLEKKFPLIKCDPKNPNVTPIDYKNYLVAPPEIKFLAVQVFFKDGTKSKVKITKK